MNRQRLLLLILLAFLVVALIWSFSHRPVQKSVSDLKGAPGQPPPVSATRHPAASAAPAVPGGANNLRLDLLVREKPVFKGYRRNLFKPIFADEVKLMKQKAAAIRPILPPPSLPQPIVPAVPVAPPEPPRRELAKFTFLGFLKKDNRKTIFLARDKEIILVRKGDSIAGRYQAASITDQALTILVTDTGEEIVIPLVDNRSLGSAR